MKASGVLPNPRFIILQYKHIQKMKKNLPHVKNKLILIRPQKRQNFATIAEKIQSCIKINALKWSSKNYGQNVGQRRFPSIPTSSLQRKQALRPRSELKKRNYTCSHVKQSFHDLKLTSESIDKNNNNGSYNQNKQKQQVPTADIAKFIAEIKERGVIWKKNNLFQVSIKNMTELLSQFYKNIQQDKETSAFLSTKTSLNHLLKDNKKTSMSISSAFSRDFLLSKPRKMDYNFQAIDFCFKFEPLKEEVQVFWSKLQKFQKKQNDLDELNSLLHQLKYLKEQLLKQNNLFKQISKQNSHQSFLIQQNTGILAALEDEIAKKQITLAEVNLKHKQFDDYLSKQPNKILEDYALQYKAKQQELFDLAFMLEQSTPERVTTWIGSTIYVSDKCFHLNVNQFFSRLSSESDKFSITRSELQNFKTNIQFSYNKVTSKLEEIVISRYEKIKQFVNLMQKLASYTVGKREFLGQINQDMAIAKIKIQSQFDKVQTELQEYHQNDGKFREKITFVLKNLKEIVKKIQELYMKAQVFY